MNYFLYKLSFTSPVHFGLSDSALSLYTSGESFRGDRLFSALCHSALSLGGEKRLETLLNSVKSGELLLSDAMPYRGENLYLPKPYINAEKNKEVPSELRKKIKKLKWISVKDFEYFSSCVKSGDIFDPDDEQSFGSSSEQIKVSLYEDGAPYSVGTFSFKKDCGLYFIAAIKEKSMEKEINKLLYALGFSGIGGKVSSGYGKFYVDDTILLNENFDFQTEWLFNSLENKESKQHMLITTSLPKEDEMDKALENAWFQLVRCSGFVGSEKYSKTPLKKRTQYFLDSGSVLENTFQGDLYNVGYSGNHSVYRYGKPIFLGVSL